ncbi:unnamed protein product [Caenorhabditis angaria]|uniref:protein-serine/threonine phosphatase n=1 Tax=Caenorhabditis angaria TaxID=860376 RepID=A0A9P1MZ02_9PELO|nr:unnamed protein product [Caenorhabditis angaria]
MNTDIPNATQEERTNVSQLENCKMGAYLNKPIVEKERDIGTGKGFNYACTSMQGWRANQEDAHNCVVDIHDDWNLFAVYDGHGGSEVSKYTAEKFPEFLKDRKFWEQADVETCLQKAFVDFDDFLRSEDAMKELAVLSGNVKEKKGDDSEDEADRIETIEESGLPLAEIIKRYGGVMPAGGARSLLSAFLQQHPGSDSDEDEEDEEEEENEDEEGGDEENAEPGEEKKKEEAEGNGIKKNNKKRCSKSPIQSEAKKSKSEEVGVESEAKGDNGTASDGPGNSEGTVTESSKDEADEDDADFVAGEEEEEDDEDEEDEDEEDEDEPDFESLALGGGAETPGEDSGTTACVCLVGKDKIIVANAGDSRAVLCRAGKALDLSVDHKPEDEVETNRIHKAGGIIEEGRVNGGLNLSRALGDHSYKKNEKLELREQMITALPDVKVEALTNEDEFLIVACDGIWNSMESQEVIDFARDLLSQGKTCTEVCDALCDRCLADSTDGDGTGCDNMTIICTQFAREK